MFGGQEESLVVTRAYKTPGDLAEDIITRVQQGDRWLNVAMMSLRRTCVVVVVLVPGACPLHVGEEDE
jgi:hypothetical protein